ncbi:MAG: hypothetical protein ABIJ59_14285 [Pseudomonadota bacterium]
MQGISSGSCWAWPGPNAKIPPQDPGVRVSDKSPQPVAAADEENLGKEAASPGQKTATDNKEITVPDLQGVYNKISRVKRLLTELGASSGEGLSLPAVEFEKAFISETEQSTGSPAAAAGSSGVMDTETIGNSPAVVYDGLPEIPDSSQIHAPASQTTPVPVPLPETKKDHPAVNIPDAFVAEQPEKNIGQTENESNFENLPFTDIQRAHVTTSRVVSYLMNENSFKTNVSAKTDMSADPDVVSGETAVGETEDLQGSQITSGRIGISFSTSGRTEEMLYFSNSGARRVLSRSEFSMKEIIYQVESNNIEKEDIRGLTDRMKEIQTLFNSMFNPSEVLSETIPEEKLSLHDLVREMLDIAKTFRLDDNTVLNDLDAFFMDT